MLRGLVLVLACLVLTAQASGCGSVDTPTAAVQPTPTSESSRTPSPSSGHPPTARPATPTKVLIDVDGWGTSSTPVFTPSSGDWQIAYSFTCPDGQFGLVIVIYAGDGSEKVSEIDQDAYNASGTNAVSEHDLNGPYHLTIIAAGSAGDRTGCNWRVVVKG